MFPVLRQVFISWRWNWKGDGGKTVIY